MEQEWERTESAGAPGYYRVKKDIFWGIRHETMGVLVLGQWDRIGDFEDGFFRVFKTDRLGRLCWGLVDAEGKVVTPCRWYYEEEPRYPEQKACSNGSFVNGYAVVLGAEGYGFIDREGRQIGPCRWDYVECFTGNGMPVRVFEQNEERMRVISCVDFPEDYPTYMRDWSEEVYYEDGFYYLTPDGTVLTPKGALRPEEDEELPDGWAGNWYGPSLFDSCGVVQVEVAGRWMDMTAAGKFRFPGDDSRTEWDAVDNITEVSRTENKITVRIHLCAVKSGGKWGLAWNGGSRVEPCQWERLRCPKPCGSRRLIPVMRDGKWGLLEWNLDTGSREITPCQWDEIDTECYDSLIKVTRNGRWGLLDADGKEITPCQWQDMEVYRDAVKVKGGNLWGLLDAEGNPVIPCRWRELEYNSREGLVRVKSGGRYGLLDRFGRELLPCEWEEIGWDCGDGTFPVKRDGRYTWFRIDGEGNLRQALPGR